MASFVRDDAAVLEADHPLIGGSGQALVGDDDDGLAGPRQVCEEARDFLRVPAVQVSRRLVGYYQPRIVGQGPS